MTSLYTLRIGRLSSLTLASLALMACGAEMEGEPATVTAALSAAWSWSGNQSSPGNNECGPGAVACTKGNYNESFKLGRCSHGRTPGANQGQTFYKGHVTIHKNGQGGTWDKGGTTQDHKGVCLKGHDDYDAVYMHDGCTGYVAGSPPPMTHGPLAGWSPRNWGQVFHGACVMHDLCYQNEPGWSGASRTQCDQVFRQVAGRICEAAYEDNRFHLFSNPFPKRPETRCKSVANESHFFLSFGPMAHYNKYNFSGPWSESDVCPSGYTFDVMTTTCIPASTRLDSIVALRAQINGQYVAAENAGSSPLIANRGAVGAWETFDLLLQSDWTYTLQARANGKIVTVDPVSKKLSATTTNTQSYERFQLVRNADGTVSLRSWATGQFVSAENEGRDELIANRASIGAWERFYLERRYN